MLVNNKLLAQLGLLITSLIWGATFLVVKDALHPEGFPPLLFAGIRFILAAFCILAFVEIKLIRKEFLGPAVCGLILFIGYAFQNYGLVETTPTKSAFITNLLPVPKILFSDNLALKRAPSPLEYPAPALKVPVDPSRTRTFRSTSSFFSRVSVVMFTSSK